MKVGKTGGMGMGEDGGMARRRHDGHQKPAALVRNFLLPLRMSVAAQQTARIFLEARAEFRSAAAAGGPAAWIGQRTGRIDRSRATRSSVAGWVANSPAMPRPDSGFMIIIWAVSGWASARIMGTPRA